MSGGQVLWQEITYNYTLDAKVLKDQFFELNLGNQIFDKC